ncbi:MAG: hypothetical protein RBS77_06560 [Candidatus Moranbacteria bacterium]|jgi:hypothetical protein|nr:hypothetical protein [Candidatus Moranbacteria bacterium]
MEDIVFNKKGVPLVFRGKNFFGSTVRSVSSNEKVTDVFYHNKLPYAKWGSSNDYPEEALEMIGKTGVLSTGLNYKARCCFGQGVLPVTVKGLDDKNNEILEPVNNPEVLSFLRGYAYRNYATNGFRDLGKLGNMFPVFIFNSEGTKIIRLYTENARHCRMSIDKTKLLIAGNIKDLATAKVITLLDEFDPMTHLEILRVQGKLKGAAVAFPRIKNYFSNNDYYALPDWDSAWKSGWIEVAHKIPLFLKKAYENALHFQFHVQIPSTFWDQRFPGEKYESEELRQKAISDFMDAFEKNLTSEENASKALFTTFNIDELGKMEGKWAIDRIDNQVDAKERLSTSAAANSEILFSLMVNPSVLGAGMPGGPYSGNAGSGSDIREGFLVSLILNYVEKQQILDPVEVMLQFNGVQNVELIYRNIILLTLDKGKSTEEKLS